MNRYIFPFIEGGSTVVHGVGAVISGDTFGIDRAGSSSYTERGGITREYDI